MGEAKFTKGPWVARGSTPSRIYGMQRADKEVLVAACGSVISQAGSNAHLIAAAPEIYKMLEEISDYSKINGDYLLPFHVEDIDNLLAKARGEK